MTINLCHIRKCPRNRLMSIRPRSENDLPRHRGWAKRVFEWGKKIINDNDNGEKKLSRLFRRKRGKPTGVYVAVLRTGLKVKLDYMR